jgi:integrase
MTEAITMALVNLKYVVRDRDRHGTARVYFRRFGRKTRLHAPEGTEAFMAEYLALLDGTGAFKSKPTGAIADGSWRWLCTRYFASAEFKRLEQSTQRVRRRLLELTFEEPREPGSRDLFGDCPVQKLGAAAVRVLRDRKANFPEAANGRVKAIRQVLAWGLESHAQIVRSNPARDVPYLKSGGTGFHSWTVDEVERYRAHHAIGTKARLALELVLLTGVRRSDLVLLGRQHVRQGWIKFTAHKGRNRSPVIIDVPVLPALQAVIDASPCGDLTFLVTDYGRPFTAPGFGNKMRTWCNEAGLPECSTHGLRKAGAATAAENGATDHQLMSIFGWLTIKEAQRYTRAARRKKMAGDGMAFLEVRTKSD